MKIILKRTLVAAIVLGAFTVTAQQNRDLDNNRPVDKRGKVMSLPLMELK